MSRLLLILLTIFYCTISFADCDAAALNLEEHSGPVLGFEISKIWDLPDEPKKQSNDTEIKFGDYNFRFSPKNKSAKPVKVSIDRKQIVEKLTSSLSKGKDESGEIDFTVGSVEGYDLNADKDADVFLFEVRSSNTHSGAVGKIGKKWVTLVNLTCL